MIGVGARRFLAALVHLHFTPVTGLVSQCIFEAWEITKSFSNLLLYKFEFTSFLRVLRPWDIALETCYLFSSDRKHYTYPSMDTFPQILIQMFRFIHPASACAWKCAIFGLPNNFVLLTRKNFTDQYFRFLRNPKTTISWLNVISNPNLLKVSYFWDLVFIEHVFGKLNNAGFDGELD